MDVPVSALYSEVDGQEETEDHHGLGNEDRGIQGICRGRVGRQLHEILDHTHGVDDADGDEEDLERSQVSIHLRIYLMVDISLTADLTVLVSDCPVQVNVGDYYDNID